MNAPTRPLTGSLARGFRLIVIDVDSFGRFCHDASKDESVSKHSLEGRLMEEQRRVTRAIYAVGMVFAGDDPFFDQFVEFAAERAKLYVKERFRRLSDGDLDILFSYEHAVQIAGLCDLSGGDLVPVAAPSEPVAAAVQVEAV